MENTSKLIENSLPIDSKNQDDDMAEFLDKLREKKQYFIDKFDSFIF